VHGGPCSTTLQRTLRARQLWQAFDALRLTALAGRVPLEFRPASAAVRLGERGASMESPDGDDPSEGQGLIPTGMTQYGSQSCVAG
jgi:hypothetical protein